MKKQKVKLISGQSRMVCLAVLLLSLSLQSGILAQGSKLQTPFRYVITNNSVEDVDDPENASRVITVLLDIDSFSEANLRKLSKFLMKKYPSPNWLTVAIYTSLKQIRNPEEDDLPLVTSSKSNPEFDNYPSAILIRYRKNEFFRYMQNTKDGAMKTVILKGEGTQGSGK